MYIEKKYKWYLLSKHCQEVWEKWPSEDQLKTGEFTEVKYVKRTKAKLNT